MSSTAGVELHEVMIDRLIDIHMLVKILIIIIIILLLHIYVLWVEQSITIKGVYLHVM